MKYNIIAAAILAFGLIVAAFLYGGRYYFIRIDKCTVARGDRWTGEVITILASDELGCEIERVM